MRAPEHPHVTDDCLIALYFGDELGTPDERKAVRQHLHGCESCTWRYAELTAPLQLLRHDAATEADEVFTQARLDAQRVSIASRIDTGTREGRVVPFPSASTRPSQPRHARPVLRWVMAAAAAGLLVGLSVGRLLIPGPAHTPAATTAVHAVSPASGPVVRQTTYSRDAASEEDFLHELATAGERHRIPELLALDEMTPRARDVVAALR